MVAIGTYSLKQHADHALSPHFVVKEFACKDGSDAVKIADALVQALEAIRAHFGKPVKIGSGYRTPEYNKKIGGAKSSQHMLGTAADIRIAGGVGLYEYSGKDESRSFCHVDVREKRARWLRTDPNGKDVNVQGFEGDTARPALRRGDRGSYVEALQRALGLAADGIFGPNTEGAVRAYQIQHGLKGDGIVGPLTWKAMEG